MTSHAAGPETGPYEVAIEEREGWGRRLTITVPPERVARSRETERARLARTLNLKGFRRGRVPPQVVEQRFGQLVDERAVRALVDETFRDVVRTHRLRPVGEPSVGHIHYARGERLTFQVELEVMPVLDLKRTGGFRVRVPQVETSEAEVERLLEELRAEHAVWEPVDRPPEGGDLVSVRIAPAGEEGGGPAGEAKPYRFPLGQGQAIPDVEASIRSLRPGEARTFEVTFPEDGGPERAGKRRLHIELVSVAARRLPELDDAFASAVGSFDTLEALRSAIRDDLRRHLEREREAALRDRLIDEIVEANPFVVPRALVDDFLERAVKPPEGTDPEEVTGARESLRPHAEREIRRSLVVDHLIEREGLEATLEEVETRVRELAARRGRPAAEVRRELRSEDRLAALARQVAVEKLFDSLKARSTLE